MKPPHYYDQELWLNGGRIRGVPLYFILFPPALAPSMNLVTRNWSILSFFSRNIIPFIIYSSQDVKWTKVVLSLLLLYTCKESQY